MAPIIPLWILFVVLLGLSALCVRAVLVERAEGLAPSTRRLAAAVVTTLVLGGIAVYASTISAEPPAAAKIADWLSASNGFFGGDSGGGPYRSVSL